MCRRDALMDWLGGAVFKQISLAAATLCLAVVFMADVPAWAQSDAEEIRAEYDELFQQVFRDPGNLDLTFQFAEVAVQMGNYEAAVSSLERMLLYNPNLPRVRLELGVLYFRLGSYALARAYLTRAVEGGEVPDEVRERVEVFLAEIEKRLSPSQFSGSVYGGFRHQTNANSGPDSTAVKAAGFDALLDNSFTEQADSNAFLSGTLRHTYDIQDQAGTVWETNAFAYGTRQNEVKSVELLVLSLDTGPRVTLDQEAIPGASMRTYITTDQVWLRNSHFLQSIGVGMTISKEYESDLNTEIDLRMRKRDFEVDGNRATASEQSGIEKQVRISARYPLAADWLISGSGLARYQDANADINTNTEFELAFTATHVYAQPFAFGETGDPWTSALTLAGGVTRFDEPNPLVDPTKKRIDTELQFTFFTAVPVTKALTFIGTIQRSVTDSSLPNFEFNNSTVSLGASWRF